MNKRLLLPVLLVAGLVLVGPNSPTYQPTTAIPTVLPAPLLTVRTLVSGKLSSDTPTVVSSAVSQTRSVTARTVTRNAPSPVAPKIGPITTTGYASRYLLKQVGDLAVSVDGTSYPNRSYTAVALPNDPQANQPWVTQANLSAAWDVPHGSSPTLLAIIDTGFALKHQEFANRWYINPGEVGPTTKEAPSQLNCTDRGLPLDQSCNLIDDNHDGIVDNETGPTTFEAPSRLNCTDRHIPLDKSCNMIDNDGNGFINDVTGWDFAYNTASVQAGKVTPSGVGTHHGTYTTGVAAATGNNGVGIAGVDWGTTILPIQALDDTGAGNTVSVANAIDYAVSRHANVISLSLGSTADDPFVHAAVRRAVAAGIIVVAAAGNDGCDCMLYPANYPEVVSVGALDTNGQPANFSSYGTNLKILAPGVNLNTTDWQATNQTSAYASGISGTSLATPIVAGLLTRLLSQQPTASAAQLVAALTESANHTGLTIAAPHSNSLGYGTIDAGQASLRMATSKTYSQPINVSYLASDGSLFKKDSATGQAYKCPLGVIGTTPIYELEKGVNTYFAENFAAIQQSSSNGYTTSYMTYGCFSQPQDTLL